ncbi:hypothetical protein TBLA_0B03410 [Henningerozyma blattae CBS 6284]|uniref:Ketoreductase (KR) domain-containing protein n=1 Tax=Henningerozyma blattae (strain ATCC 34711 / CBS 6284 / DSM 70876 / NBRC 10599 / NRRL Y-10934 / UCD 77-7) TaxID=1071380 RepID=I2GYI0_HENB6|nr:hypothetical protein TBLA_0B03410 [Tetrapisispora blattae CBS 6284]CCH59182.1 hypothetical protein TBLA_0B03410 [Tetrapisispora blattae CBS 6284]
MTEPTPSYSYCQVTKDILQGFRPVEAKFLPKDYPALSNKTAIVTGCNTGIGFGVMRLLYEKNRNVIGEVKRPNKKVLQEFPLSKGSISIIGNCDFSDLENIPKVALEIKNALSGRPINLIIHNAGLMSSSNNGTSKQGYKAMFQTNVMGPQLLQYFLDPLFLKQDDDLKRIGWVSSGAHLLRFPEYGINWEDPGFTKVLVTKRPSANKLYGQSKASNILQAKAYATKNREIFDKMGCISVSVYPGNLKTYLQRYWGWLRRKTIGELFFDGKYGAYTELYAALSPELTVKDQGSYVVPFGAVAPPRSDVAKGLLNGTDLKFWDMVDNMIELYKEIAYI